MSMSGILNIGTTALLASQSALKTTSNNVANASTTGYTRQQVELSSIPSGLFTTTGTSGNGVTVSDVTRLYDSFTTLQLRTEKANTAYWDTYSGYASSVENVFNETSSTGMSSAISDFFSAWQQVSQNPQDTSARTALLSKAQYLASRISGAYNELADQQTQIYKDTQNQVTQINNITKQIYTLNEQIVSSPGALDLQDQRDSLIEQLNQITKVSTVQDNSGRYNVFIGGTPLVNAAGSYDVSVTLDTNNDMQFTVGSQNINSEMSGGKLMANLDMRDTTIAGYITQLNTFATDFSNAINTANAAGYGLDSSHNINFFTTPTLYAARDMQVAITDPDQVAASSTAAGIPGDNTNAQAIANLADSKIIDGNSLSPIDYYSNMVAAAGNDAQSATTYVNFQNSLVNQLESQRQAASGVNLDEEAANLIQFQKSYEAAAKMISIGSDLLDTVIGMIK